MQEERRRSKRMSTQQAVSITLGNGGGIVTAVSDNVSPGGALFYCDCFISPGSEVGLIIVLPLELTNGIAVQVWCCGKVLRVENELREGKFVVAIEFLSLQKLSSA